ncbi:MAG: rod shape-determining protein MreC [Sphingobacteriaceae bacterium]|nr:MAG: rod shape-determining protein MreC [Pedobacter sp.]
MRNLWIFVSKYNAFFLFCIFFIISLTLLLNNNTYQRAWTLNVSNQFIGRIYEQTSYFKNYLHLEEVNNSLALENARLKNELRSSFLIDRAEKHIVTDSVRKQQYSYIVARVVNNSIHLRNNYLIINRGTRHGVERGMGVTGPDGIVGVVREVSENFARVQSVLHAESRFSANVNGSIGSLVWEEENMDSKTATLKDVPGHVKVKPGDLVTTSGYSLFPMGIRIGTVKRTELKSGNSFLDIEVTLSTDFSSLQYVYVVNNLLAKEQQAIEAQPQMP